MTLNSVNTIDVDYKYLYKIIIVGETSVGKSNIISRYLNGEFNFNSTNTLGAELSNKYLTIKDRKTKLQIWDTAGQERYHSIISAYFKGAHGCFVVYDITNDESFDKVDFWLESVRKLANKNVSFVLVGNKSDLEDSRLVSKERGEEKAKDLNCPFLETSALSDININEIFNVLLENIYAKNDNQISQESDDNERQNSEVIEKMVDISTKKGEKKKKCC